jgi:plasmid stabilization system protein ParE
MKYRVVLTARAERDRDEAFGWYANNYSREFAVRWYAGLTRAIRSLRQNPLRCGRAHESGKFSFDLREMLFGSRRQKHRILFTLEDDLVVVLHIRHSSRQDVTEEDL